MAVAGKSILSTSRRVVKSAWPDADGAALAPFGQVADKNPGNSRPGPLRSIRAHISPHHIGVDT